MTYGRWIAALCLSLFAGPAWSVGTMGAASSIVFPVAAKTSSFETEVFVRNQNAFQIQVDVLYYEANGLPSPGLKACSVLTLAANSVVAFKLGVQCPSLASGSHFGLLVLRDHAAEKTNTFGAFSRVQHVTTNQGFSIEGFPEHVFSGRASGSIGLKRAAASVPPTQAQPGYQPNCFIGSLGEAVDYKITVFDANGAQLGPVAGITGSLGPYQLVRYLDILAAAGAPAGDRSNFRVLFDNTSTPAEPAYVAFCTLQDNLSFGADFRIAKSVDGANITLFKTRCRGTNENCDGLSVPAAFAIPNASTKYRFSMFVHHPDHLRCEIIGPNAGNLEIRLLAPAPSGQAAGGPIAGGNDVSFFYHATGARNAVGDTNGFQTFWNLEVSPRESAPPAFPADFGLKCLSGSGIHLSSSPSSLTDDF